MCTRLLTVRPENRISVEEAMKHEWMTGKMTVEEDDIMQSPPPKKKITKQFAVPSSKKKKKGEKSATLNPVLQLINQREAGELTSPDLGFNKTMTGSMTDKVTGRPLTAVTPGSSSFETTPLLPAKINPVDDLENLDNVADPSGPVIIRKLAFETPEKKRKSNIID